MFFKSNHPEFAASFTFLNRHHTVVFDFRLQMSILRRLLPKRVNLRLARFLEDLRKAGGFDFKQFHKKSARELRSRRIKLPLLHSCPGGFLWSSIRSP